jgi:hypothetical protein
MPVLPYITDTEQQLEILFAAFKNAGAKYVFPASLTLFGDQAYHSKPLVMVAIKKHYPDLEKKYSELFAFGHQPPSWYRSMFQKRVLRISEQYGLKNTLIDQDFANPRV